MKIIVLLQSGIPISAYPYDQTLPPWKINDIGQKHRRAREEMLKDAYKLLNPETLTEDVIRREIPIVTTAIVELEEDNQDKTPQTTTPSEKGTD